MGISVIGGSASASGGGTNNFVLRVNSSTTYGLDRTYASGRYELVFSDNDTTFDIYAIAENGSYAGYTNNTVLEVSEDFSELVVLGGAPGARISFTHLGVISEAITSGDVAAAGAFINSVGTSSLPDIDDFTIVNGGNFAADVQVSFIGQDTTETAAKAVVRSSSTQLLVTRPDSFSPDNSPYTVKVVNPGIPVPVGTNAHLLSNSVTAGTNPAWTTPTDIYYNVGGATSITLLATDTEGSDIDYSLISGTLPAGLTLDNETGVISGTFSGTANEGDVTNITVRAIDTGGNFLDRAFNLTANTAPTWITAAGALDPAPTPDTAYSFQLQASTGTAGGALTYTLVSGALLTGHTLSSTGLVSGTSTDPVDTVANFTVRVTDEGGLFAERSFSTTVVQANPWQVGASFLPDINFWAQGTSPDKTGTMIMGNWSGGTVVYSSTDGVTWTARNSVGAGHYSARMEIPDDGTWFSMDEGNGFGYADPVRSNTAGGTQNWDRSWPYGSSSYKPYGMRAVAGNDLLFGGSGSYKFIREDNGSWYQSTSGAAQWTVYSGVNTERNTVLLIDESNPYYIRTGANWSLYEDRSFPVTMRNDAAHLGTINRWITAPYNAVNVQYTSDDNGISWTARSAAIGQARPRGIGSSGTKVVILNSNNEFYATADGINWVANGSVPASQVGSYTTITYFDGKWFIGANDGNVVFANDADIMV